MKKIFTGFICSLLILSCTNKLFVPNKQIESAISATITANVPDHLEGDTIRLALWEIFIAGNNYFKPYTYTTVVREGSFKFQVPMKFQAQYFILTGLGISSLESSNSPQLIEQADYINIDIAIDTVIFSGKGSVKLRFKDDIEKMMQSDEHAPKRTGFLSKDNIEKNLMISDAIVQYQKNILQRYKSLMSPMTYNILLTDIIAFEERIKYNTGTHFFNHDSTSRLKALKIYNNKLGGNHVPLINEVPVQELALSAQYASFLFKKLDADLYYKFMKTSPTRDEFQSWYRGDKSIVDQIKKYDGLLRDKMLFLYAYRIKHRSSQQMLEETLKDNLAVNNTRIFEAEYKNWLERFAKGVKAYDFSMQDTAGNTVRLSDFAGKVVFIDLWFTGCGACKQVVEGMPELEKVFAGNKDVVFVSISIDVEKDKWLQSISPDAKKSKKYYFGGDYYSGDRTIYLYTGGRGSSDPFVKKYVTGGYPSLLLIDRKGNIFSTNPPRPRKGNPHAIIQEINNALNN